MEESEAPPPYDDGEAPGERHKQPLSFSVDPGAGVLSRLRRAWARERAMTTHMKALPVEKKEAILSALAAGHTLPAACAKAGANLKSVSDTLESARRPEATPPVVAFAQAVEAARGHALSNLEKVIMGAALEGATTVETTKKPVVHKGLVTDHATTTRTTKAPPDAGLALEVAERLDKSGGWAKPKPVELSTLDDDEQVAFLMGQLFQRRVRDVRDAGLRAVRADPALAPALEAEVVSDEDSGGDKSGDAASGTPDAR